MKKFFAFLLGIFLIVPTFADNAVTGSGTECVYSTLNTYTGPSTIKANWDPNTINLYWYDEGQRVSVQTAANTCDYDSGITLPSSNPTKTGYTFTGWEVSGGIPAEYTMLEYIQSSGTQWINTGITVSDKTKDTVIEFTGKWNVIDQSPFGAQNGSTRTFCTFQQKIYCGDGGNRLSYVIPNTTNVHTLKGIWTASSSTLTSYVDGVLQVSGVQSGSFANVNMYIGTINGGSGMTPFSGYIYSAKITIANELVFNGIPVKRNNDNVVGMYDTVSQTFKTSAGSGSFTAGPAIQ